MRLNLTKPSSYLALPFLAAFGFAIPLSAQSLPPLDVPQPALQNAPAPITAKSFSLDNWEAHLLPPEAPTPARLYKGDDANALAYHPRPATPITVTAGPLPAASVTGLTKNDDDRLAALAVEDRDFFSAIAQNPYAWPETERDRRAQVLHDRYLQYILDYPQDVNAVVLYGKLLARVGHADLAYEVFRRAEELDPKLAVVKQQLANHFAETGDPAKALDLLRQAEALAPAEPVYHYEIGELLNLLADKFVAAKLYDEAGLDKNMEYEFARAAALAPEQKGFAWRHAESFYDQHQPDWNAALAAWEALAQKSTEPAEAEIIRLHRARALLELGKFADARALLGQPVRPALEASRQALLKRLPAEPSPTSPAPAVSPPATAPAPAASPAS